MIGPSTSSTEASPPTSADNLKRHHQQRRTLLDELDIESICDEVCGHHHHFKSSDATPTSTKRPRFASELQLMQLEREALVLPTDEVFATYFEQQQSNQQQQQEQMLQQQQVVSDGASESAPVAKLEVLVVDGTWDDALESLEAATQATSQACTDALTDLASEPSLQASHQQEIQSLHQSAVDFQNQTYWSNAHQSQTSSHEHHHHQQQTIQSPQAHQQQQHQATMPKAHQTSATENGRHSRGFATLNNGNNNNHNNSNYEDQENGNLSWLLDFKLDSFIEAPEDKTTLLLPRDFQANKSSSSKFNGNSSNSNSNSNSSINGKASSSHESARKTCNNNNNNSNSNNNNNNNNISNNYEVVARCDGRHSPSVPCGLSPPDNRKPVVTGPKKPPFTYTELIEHALQERGELTVSAIYQWISERFPYYKSNDDRWKNSVRHNLSINPHFRKGSKAPHGAGHLWAIASQDESKPRQLFNIATIRQALRNEEAAAAAAAAAKTANVVDTQPEEIDEVAAATASISQPQDDEDSDIVDAITLEHCAEQILSGIKKEVEVQYLVPMMVSSSGEDAHNQACQASLPSDLVVDSLGSIKDTDATQHSLKISLPNFPDFLNPVSKEVVAEECGLLGEGYLVTDLNPASLGLNMTESEVVNSDNLFGEELSFQFYEFATAASSQLQSA